MENESDRSLVEKSPGPSQDRRASIQAARHEEQLAFEKAMLDRAINSSSLPFVGATGACVCMDACVIARTNVVGRQPHHQTKRGREVTGRK